jgi:ribosomal protein L20A (L18A)
MKFIVEGKIKVGKENQRFVKEIEAASKERATELAYQRLGADHGLKRTQVGIEKVDEWKE